MTGSINIPNQITLARLALGIVFFVLLSMFSIADLPNGHWTIVVGFWVFLVAALSDVLDGYLARRWGQVTSFGRIVDPFVDKVMVCGAFVFFASSRFIDPETGTNVTGVAAWMAVVILSREMLVSALRSHSEAQGRAYAANWAGKTKMLIQSITACTILGTLAFSPFASWQTFAHVCVWITVLVTAVSAIPYVRGARGFLLSTKALGGTSLSAAADNHKDNQPPAGASN